jgi:hypothetical protein
MMERTNKEINTMSYCQTRNNILKGNRAHMFVSSKVNVAGINSTNNIIEG